MGSLPVGTSIWVEALSVRTGRLTWLLLSVLLVVAGATTVWMGRGSAAWECVERRWNLVLGKEVGWTWKGTT